MSDIMTYFNSGASLSNFLPCDLTQTQQILEHELLPPVHYYNNFGEEHQLNMGSATAAATLKETGREIENNNSATMAVPYSNIPFVQIHTTNVKPQRRSFGNVFRRSASNHDEIKSEPIKSENSDTSKERLNGTPTPPVRNRSCSNGSGNEMSGLAANESLTNVENNVTLTASTKESSATQAETFPTIHKCSRCAFISLSEQGLGAHEDNAHTDAMELYGNNETACRQRITCPGCENIFYALNTLELHLHEDHLMTAEDCKQLLHAVKKIQNAVVGKSAEQSEADTSIEKVSLRPTTTKDETAQPKSRIYLKNVECLREPHREPIEQQHNQITENFFQLNAYENDTNMLLNNINENDYNSDMHISNNCVLEEPEQRQRNPNPPKQKISIKSVDVLREPNLLRRDYGMQTFNTFLNSCNDLDLHAINATEQYNYASPSDNLQNNNNNNSNVNCSNGNNEATNNFENFEKPRRPKIYIKNVDILKEPMILSSNLNIPQNIAEPANNVINFNFMSQTIAPSEGNYMESVENLTTPSTYEGNLTTIPTQLSSIAEQYLFDGSNNNNSTNFLSNVVADENFNFVASQSNNNFYTDELEYNLDTATPIITEPTPPPPPSTLSLCNALVENTLNASASLQSINSPQQQQQQQQQQSQQLTMPVTMTASATTTQQMQQKQKIFIKNVDILKEPQFQEQRGTLHLRTVDELNLMNRKEVENLITPNLENTQQANSNLNTDFNELDDMLENNKLHDDSLYGSDHFKLQEFDAHVNSSWPDDYDLGADIDCIITDSVNHMNTSALGACETTTPLQRIPHDLDTPQISLISIRDIDELTIGGGSIEAVSASNNNIQQETLAKPQNVITPSNGATESVNISNENHSNDAILETQHISNYIDMVHTTKAAESNCYFRTSQKEQAERHTENKQQHHQQTTARVATHEKPKKVTATTTVPMDFSDIPPLVPVTPSTGVANETNTTRDVALSALNNTSSIPLPPLVPVSQVKQLNVVANKTANNSIVGSAVTNMASNAVQTPASAPVEKGRIYVANNLMQTANDKPNVPVAVSVTGGTSIRGRPFGSNRTGITKMRRLYGNAAELETGLKCNIQGCAFRFKKQPTLEYHRRCHSSESTASTATAPGILCPECKTTDFTNWNTLHTHLWRTHKIDMELYSCELCSFKTPIYSRLINTHSKIHYDDRNYKCDQCEKAFKNTKQLKNHRRWHRNHAAAATASEITLHRCSDCAAVFSNQKTLREHICQQVQCEICGRIVSSKSSLKLHMHSHNTDAAKRFKCNSCQYTSNDHNAFRRHKQTHEETTTKMYACPQCSYKSIQSFAYQKHLQQKHPAIVDSIVHKCTACTFSTINRTLFAVHQAKHDITKIILEKRSIIGVDDNTVEPQEAAGENDIDMHATLNVTRNQQDLTKNKIKVKSNLTLPANLSQDVNGANAIT